MNKISSYLIRKKPNLFFFFFSSEKNGILLGLVAEKVMPTCPFWRFWSCQILTWSWGLVSAFSFLGWWKRWEMPEQLVGFLCLCVLGRGGRSQKSLWKCHFVNWNNRDSVTGWLYEQIHPSLQTQAHPCVPRLHRSQRPAWNFSPLQLLLQRLEANKVVANRQLMECACLFVFLAACSGFAWSQWSLIGSCSPGGVSMGAWEKG